MHRETMVAWLSGRASPSHGGGHRFKSCSDHHETTGHRVFLPVAFLFFSGIWGAVGARRRLELRSARVRGQNACQAAATRKAAAATPGLVRRGRAQAAPVSLACRRLRHGKATAAACALRLAGRGLAGRRPPRPALPGSCPPPCRGLLCRRLLERGPSAKFNKRSASWAWRIARTCGKMLTVRATARAESRNAEACGNAGDAR